MFTSNRCAFVLLANVVSTVPGVLIAAFAAAGPVVVLILPIIYGLGRMVERRTRHLPATFGKLRLTGGRTSIAFTLFFVLAMVLYGMTQVACFCWTRMRYLNVEHHFLSSAKCRLCARRPIIHGDGPERIHRREVEAF
jgi:hypothetical protein